LASKLKKATKLDFIKDELKCLFNYMGICIGIGWGKTRISFLSGKNLLERKMK
jgi:hypothetical protein